MICSRSSQSIKIGIDLSINKSTKIGISDLIDIDCIGQSVEIDARDFYRLLTGNNENLSREIF